MEHSNQETFLKLSPYNFEYFAETDNLLRSGVHIQNHKSQRRLYNFIEDNEDTLKTFYDRIYKAKLQEQPTVDNKFYYLDTTEARNKIFNRTKLDQHTTLFAIFLYWLHKMEKQFSYDLSKSEVIEVLNTNHNIKPHIQKLFFGEEKENTLSVDKTLNNWVDVSIAKLVKIGWVFFLDEERFELLPAFERIAHIYNDAIHNIDNIKLTFDSQN